MSVCGCLYPDIPDEIRLWGESYLALDNVYRIIGDQLFSFLPEEELTSMYASGGRSSINPIVLSFVTIFQYLEDIPDRVAALWVKTRLDWKYALHLPLEDGGFHYADLCNFRKRLLTHGKESLLFEELLQKIESLGFLKKRGSQRTDSTHVLAVVRQLSRLENLSEGLRMALKAIQEADGAFYQAKLPVLYREHWSKPLSDYQMTDDERKAALERVGQDMHWLLGFLKTDRESFLRLPELKGLQALFSQHFTLQAQAVSLKKEAAPGKEKIQTPHDPEARYSTKHGKGWTGYKVHITETANEKGEVNFVTDVTTTNACERDSETLPHIQDTLEERSLKPEEQFVDKGYTTGDNLADSQKKGIKLMGEVSELENNGLFTADEFTIDFQAKTALCPAGCTCCSWKEFESGNHQGEVEIRFGPQCQDCPLKERCTLSKAGRKLRLHRQYPLLKARREEGKTESFKQAMKRRPPVEGTISELVRTHGLRKSRYRGIAKTHLQNLMKGAALNLKRVIKRLSLPENVQEQHLAAA